MRKQILEIGRDSFWYLLSIAISAVVAFIGVPILTRLLNPHEYGIYALVATTISMVAPLFFVWQNVSTVRFYPEYKKRDELEVFYSTIFHFAPHFTLFFLAIVLPLAAFVLPLGRYRGIICLGIAVFTLFTLFRVAQGLVQARQKAKWYALHMVLNESGRFLVGAALLAWFSMGVAGIFVGWLAVLVVVIVIQVFVLSSWKYFRWHKYSPKLERKFFRFGFVLVFANMLSTELILADRYFVQAFRGAYEVGLYSVVYSIVTSIILVLIGFVGLGAAPVVIKTYENEGELPAIKLIGRLTRYMFILVIPGMLGLWVLRERVLSVLTSAKYVPAAKVMGPLVLGLLLAELSLMPSLTFHLRKNTKWLLAPVGASAGLNVLLNFLLIPKYGYPGAAWSTFFSYLLYFAVTVVISRRYMTWEFPWVGLAKVSIASAAMGASLYFLNGTGLAGAVGLLLMVAAGTVVYLAVFLAIGGFSKSELKFAISVPGRLVTLVRSPRRKPE